MPFANVGGDTLEPVLLGGFGFGFRSFASLFRLPLLSNRHDSLSFATGMNGHQVIAFAADHSLFHHDVTNHQAWHDTDHVQHR